jgi:peptidyl-tRNA hydrolase
MTAGKAAALAGHAFLDSFHEAPCAVRRTYLGQGPAAIKVTLRADDDVHLLNIAQRCRKAGVPCALVIEPV